MADASTVLFIAGPGGTAFDKNDVERSAENFRKAGARVVTVGDGARDVSLTEIGDAAKKIEGDALVFLYAHGNVRSNQHEVTLTTPPPPTLNKPHTPTKDVFSTLTTAMEGRKFDIFTVACHGGGAQGIANHMLPKGTVFVDLAPGAMEVAGSDATRFLDTIPHNKQLTNRFSGENLLNDYLMTDLKNRITPSLTVAGEGTYNLETILGNRLGKKFSDAEKAKAHAALDAGFGKAKVDETIHKIENEGRNSPIYAVDYGPALAVAFATHDRSKGGLQLPLDFKMPTGVKNDSFANDLFNESMERHHEELMKRRALPAPPTNKTQTPTRP